MLSKNEQKLIKSLKVKKYRTRENCFLVEGRKNVLELCASSYQIELIVSTEAFAQANESNLENNRVEVVKQKLLDSLGTFQSNSEALAVVHFPIEDTLSIDASTHLFILDGIRDPGNLGTIIRTLDWFGINQLICSEDCADFFQPKVINSSMGSFTRVRPFYCDLSKLIPSLSMPVYGADMNGVNLAQFQPNKPVAVIMGNEAQGISSYLDPLITNKITIAKYGQAESLNVGIATGIIAAHLRSL